MCEISNNVRIREDLLKYLEFSICNDAVRGGICYWFSVIDYLYFVTHWATSLFDLDFR